MFERFTKQARGVVHGAIGASETLGHRFVGTEHLLLALLDPGVGPPAAILAEAGIDRDRVVSGIERFTAVAQHPFAPGDADALQSVNGRRAEAVTSDHQPGDLT